MVSLLFKNSLFLKANPETQPSRDDITEVSTGHKKLGKILELCSVSSDSIGLPYMPLLLITPPYFHLHHSYRFVCHFIAWVGSRCFTLYSHLGLLRPDTSKFFIGKEHSAPVHTVFFILIALKEMMRWMTQNKTQNMWQITTSILV